MGKEVKKRGKTVIDTNERLKRLNNLLASIDSPNEGDSILFCIENSTVKFRGTIVKKVISGKNCKYTIESKTYPVPKGTVTMIEFKGKIFNLTEFIK